MKFIFQKTITIVDKKCFKVEKLQSRFSPLSVLEARVFSGNGQNGSQP
jgi:hypothetical protein